MSQSHAPVLRGDEDALYCRHADRLRRVVRGLVRFDSDDQLDDACATAWMILLRAQPSRESVFAWLVTVATREAWHLTAADRLRAPLADYLCREDPAELDGPESSIIARDRLRAVAQLLPERKRRILGLRALGYSHAEIARITGDTPCTVNRQLARLPPARPAAGPARGLKHRHTDPGGRPAPAARRIHSRKGDHLTAAEGTYADVGEGFDHKAARSDALKRAAVHLGIGHCLYRIAPIRMAAGPKAHELRGQPGYLELDDANHRWLRGRYRAWLTRTGNAEYGLPLHHGHAARSVAPELFPDRVPERRTRAAAPPAVTLAPQPPVLRPPVLLPAGAASSASADSPTAPTASAPGAASPPAPSPPPAAPPYGAPRPPRPRHSQAGTPAPPATAAVPAVPPAPAAGAPAESAQPTAPVAAPSTAAVAAPAAPEQRAALSEIARRLGYLLRSLHDREPWARAFAAERGAVVVDDADALLAALPADTTPPR